MNPLLWLVGLFLLLGHSPGVFRRRIGLCGRRRSKGGDGRWLSGTRQKDGTVKLDAKYGGGGHVQVKEIDDIRSA